jgi:S1-C subfamily serine protease
MSQSERRIQRIAVGFAAIAVLTTAAAVIVAWRTDRRTAALSPTRHVSASELVKLAPGAIAQADGGILVTDAALRSALGLSPGDVITAISGRSVARIHELSGLLRELAILRPRSLFVDVIRDREPVLERWELDGDLDTARRADLAARPPPGARDPRIASVRLLNPTTFAVPRETVEAWTADPAQVTSGGRAIPVLDAGEQSGFKLYAIRPGSAYAALGLEDGDVVRAINGTQLASSEQILELVARSTGQITLDLLRHGQPMIFNYLIK